MSRQYKGRGSAFGGEAPHKRSLTGSKHEGISGIASWRRCFEADHSDREAVTITAACLNIELLVAADGAIGGDVC